MNLQDIRDLVIIIAGCLMALVLFVSLIVVIVVGLATRGLISVLKTTVKTSFLRRSIRPGKSSMTSAAPRASSPTRR